VINTTTALPMERFDVLEAAIVSILQRVLDIMCGKLLRDERGAFTYYPAVAEEITERWR
jgi:hypothetical protein